MQTEFSSEWLQNFGALNFVQFFSGSLCILNLFCCSYLSSNSSKYTHYAVTERPEMLLAQAGSGAQFHHV